MKMKVKTKKVVQAVATMKFCKDGKVLKQYISMDVADLIEFWNEAIVNLKSHIYFKRKQIASYNEIKDEFTCGEIIIHVDYSESCKNAQQDEIQNAYFRHTCFIIFIACCYYKSELSDGLEKVPVTIKSELSDHSYISQARLKPEKLKKYFIWREGCASQFRSKLVFVLMTYFDKAIDIEWHYNESHHGKGPMDSVGGTVKNVVFQKVKYGHIVIDSPKQFFFNNFTLFSS